MWAAAAGACRALAPAGVAAARRCFRKVARLEDQPDSHLLPLVALVGRPNVGKSALFNRLVRRRDALVYDTPGGHVTRDYREGLGSVGDLRFKVVDTSGLEPAASPGSLQARAAALTRSVLHDADGVLMLLDARQGVVAADEELLAWLRRHNPAPLMLLANKADTAAGWRNLDQLQADLGALGAEPATPVSATSGEGMADIYQLLRPLVDAAAARHRRRWRELQERPAAAAAAAEGPPPGQAGDGAGALGGQRQQAWDEALRRGESPAAAGAAAGDGDDDEAAAARLAAEEEAAVDRLVARRRPGPGESSDDDAEGEAAAAAPARASAAGDSGPLGDQDQEEEGEEGEEEGGEEEGGGQEQEEGEGEQRVGPMRLAILGLPNAGKSTLMNRLLGYERSLTGPEPGLTRDPTYGWLRHEGTDVQLVDTAGWKRRAAQQPTQSPTAPAAPAAPGRGADAKQLADASLAQAKRALSAAHVAVLLLDAPRLASIGQAITRLELQLAGLALTHGKALVVGLNKADALPGGAAGAEALRERVASLLEERFLAAGRLPVLGLSALRGDGAAEVLGAAVEAYGKWNARFSSYRLRASLAKQSLRFFGSGGSAALLGRVKWAAQLKARPPTFVLLLRGGEEVDEPGQRFLANLLRGSLGLEGVPLRLHLRYNRRPKHAQANHPRRQARRRR